jgi:Cu(I)/Ag(I) efflux system membrane fusion protein
MNSLGKVLAGVAVGVLFGASGVWLWSDTNQSDATETNGKSQPLYWVAPMDSNYRRDKPGKSPMGMDLVPVYENDAGEEAGTVKISPEVINNLGVRFATVESGRFQSKINTVGYMQYGEDRLVHVNPRVEGWIEELYVEATGDSVKQGEPLYTLYSPTLVNAQDELRVALKRDNPTLINAAMERLVALGVPQAHIDQLRQTGVVSQTITFNAPQSGMLDSLSVRKGMFIESGTSLMSIGQLEHIWAIGEVFERQANLVTEGDQVRMQLDYLPGREWVGQVDYLYPSLDTNTRTAQVRVHFHNPDGLLKPGMFAQMIIETDPGPEVLLIPREALIRAGNQERVVLALGEGEFKSVVVEIGRVGDRQVEVLAGLNQGERIVTSAQFLIDSESSKTADFKRMEPRGDQNRQAEFDANAEPSSAWVSARIVSLMPSHRMLTLEHEAIPDWDWPAMTMDFTVDEGVDMELLNQGMRLHVEVVKNGDQDYRLRQVHIPEEKSEDNAKPVEMKHSKHEGMNHDSQGKKERRHD